MDKNMLVEVKTSFGSKKKTATGYPIAPNRIITARHALYRENNEVSGEVKVRWYHKKELPEYDWRSAKVIDCGLDPELDVALLECEFPDDVNHFCHLEENNPNKELEWEGEGFATAGKLKDEWLPSPLSGVVYNAADNAKWLVLTETGKVLKEEYWCGVSGSPVFIKGTNTIIGIVLQIPPNYEARRLHATPTWKLLQCEGFRKAIDYDFRNEQIGQLRSDIIAILDESPEVCEALCAELKTSNSNCYDLVETLIHLPVNELLKHCQAAINHSLKAQKITVATTIKKLVYYLLPVVFDQRIIQEVCSSSGSGICRVEIATETVAEIIMAGSDGRCTQYGPSDASNKTLRGIWQLEEPCLNSGFDIAGRIADFKKQIINDFASIDELVTGQSLTEQEKIDLAADELEVCSEEKKTRFYLYSLPKNDRQRDEQQKMVDELRRCFPAIVFIQCSGSNDIIRHERRQYRSLVNIHQMELEDPS